MSWDKDILFELLLAAGDVGLRSKRSLRRETKPDRSIVTQADLEIEAMLAAHLEDTEGGTYIIGEETVATKGEEYIDRAMGEECFVIDPIDGTSPYAHGLPNWGISVGRMVAGRLVDGAVYLPEFGEMVLSEGDKVLEARRDDGDGWTWRELFPSADRNASLLVGITQRVAKYGRADVRHPVQVLGAAVVPLIGLVQGRFLAYLGSVMLWDAAGALPLVLRHGFVASVREGGETRRVDEAVTDATYHLAPDSPRRWKFRSELLVCRPEDEAHFRSVLTET